LAGIAANTKELDELWNRRESAGLHVAAFVCRDVQRDGAAAQEDARTRLTDRDESGPQQCTAKLVRTWGGFCPAGA
jgi:hypothetical protein